MIERVLPTSPSCSFKVSGITLIPFEFSFVHGERHGCSFTPLYVDTSFPQHYFLNCYLFIYVCFWHFWKNLYGYSCASLFLGLPFYFYILFYFYSWSLYLPLWQSHTCFHVFVVNFGIIIVIPPTLCFLFRISLASQSIFCFHISFKIYMLYFS